MAVSHELITIVLKLIDSFPGIRYSPHSEELTRIVDRSDHVVCKFAFQNDSQGRIARMTVEFVLRRHLKLSSEPIRIDGEGRRHYRLDADQFDRFGRALRYASSSVLADATPLIEPSVWPLPETLSHALTALELDYSRAQQNVEIPSIQIWSNLLRVLGDEPVDWLDYEKRAVVTKRAKNTILRTAEEIGLIEIQKKKVGKTRKTFLRLTNRGSKLKEQGTARLLDVEKQWAEQIGQQDFTVLRETLATIVRDQDLELPFYITGYGPADASVTGGNFRAAINGPPRIPARGAEFPVVVREKETAVRDMPLSALLSQALAAFAIEYEAENLGQLVHVSNVLAHIPDEGVRLQDAKALGDITGNDKTLHERHLHVVVEPGPPRDGERRVFLTPKGKRMRDAFPYTSRKIETKWRERYGEAVHTINRVLRALEEIHGIHEPPYPSPSIWMLPWFRPYVLSGG